MDLCGGAFAGSELPSYNISEIDVGRARVSRQRSAAAAETPVGSSRVMAVARRNPDMTRGRCACLPNPLLCASPVSFQLARH